MAKNFTTVAMPRSFLLLLVITAVWWPQRVDALDHVVLRRDGQEKEIAGQLLVTAADGGLLVMSADGVLWAVQPEELVKHTHDSQEFQPLAEPALARQLLTELPEGFEVYSTAHYLVCYNTSRHYAAWCGALFERLYLGFTNYWTRKGIKLTDPKFPLVAIVFRDPQSYQQYSRAELGDAAQSIIGYYSLRSNRMTMYDLTGVDALRGPGARRGSAAQINQMLSRPEAERTVATIIHEATHQIAFNSGLQTRFADIPLWLSEGIAVYFETPDLQSSKGWRNIGAVNYTRLAQFRDYLPRRPADSLRLLLTEDKRFRDSRLANDLYAESWALTYYLIRQRPKQYVAYLQMLSEKKQMMWDTPATRLKEFEVAFGAPLDHLEVDFLRQMQKVR